MAIKKGEDRLKRRRSKEGRREGRSGWKWTVRQKKEKKMDRISFDNHTYLRPTLPFRFPPFPELRYIHTHSMPPGSLAPKIAPDVPSRTFGQGTAAR